MAQGKNAQFRWNNEFYSRRPLSYWSRNKANKTLCHKIERAIERALLFKEKNIGDDNEYARERK